MDIWNMRKDSGLLRPMVMAIIVILLLVSPLTMLSLSMGGGGAIKTTMANEVRKGRGQRTSPMSIPPAQWTLLLYFAGDNSLSEAAWDDYMEILGADINDGVNILLLMDRGGYGDSELHYISSRGDVIIPLTAVDPTWDENELDMADGRVLEAYATWAVRNSYSKHYALVLWDHGGGWEDGVCQDGWDFIEIDELAEALNGVKGSVGRGFDLIGFDACLMGQVEVFYEIKDYASYFVGSAETEPGDGWDYTGVFDALTSSTTAEGLGRIIVDTYVDSYTDGLGDPDDEGDVTMALVNNTLYPDAVGFDHTLIGRINHLAQYLIRGVREYQYQSINPVKAAYGTTKRYYVGDYGDLYNLAYNLITAQYPPVDIAGANIRQYASLVMDAINRSVYYRDGGDMGENIGGLSIYLPNVYQIMSDNPHRLSSYEDTAFASDTMWNVFLTEYASPSPTGVYNGVPTCTLDSAEYSTGLLSVTGTATDPTTDTNTVVGVEVKIDHGPWEEATIEPAPNPGEYRWTYGNGTLTLSNGLHYVYARAYDGMEYSYYAVDDPNSPHVGEFEINNPLPDLAVSIDGVNATMDEGNGLHATVSVRNVGSMGASGVDVRVYLNDDLISTRYIDVLNTGVEESIDIDLASMGAGDYTLAAVADPQRNITEVEEGNNLVSASFRVLGYGLSASLSSAEIYVTKDVGGRAFLSVRNTGTKTANYTLSAEVPEGWSIEGDTTVGPLEPSSTSTMTLRVNPSSQSYVGEEEYLLFNVSCVEKPSLYRHLGLKATVAVFFDDVEGSVLNWSIANVGSGSAWHLSPSGGYDGSGGWYCGNDATGEYDYNTDTYLYTPEIDLSGLNNATLEFDHMYSAELSYDGGCVYVDTGDGLELIYPDGGYPASGLNALEDGEGYSGESNGWLHAVFSLNDYLGSTVKFAFRFASDDTINYAGWYMDNVLVRGRVAAHDVGVENLSFSGSMVPSAVLNISVSVRNYGLFPESFKTNLKVDYGGSVSNLGNITVSNLLPTTTATLYWDYVPIDEGYYTFTATTLLTIDENADNDVGVGEVGIFTYAPVVYIDTPYENEVVDGIVTVSGRASDPNGDVVGVEVSIDNGSWTTAEDTSGNGSWATWVYAWDTMPYDNGTHVIHARAYDGTYYSQVVNRSVTVLHPGINHPPVAVITSPEEGAVYDYGANIVFDGRGSYDPDNDTLTYRWTSNVTGYLSSQPYFTTTLQPGRHLITLQVSDGHGLMAYDNVNITVNESVVSVVFHDDNEQIHGWWFPWPQSKWEWGMPQNSSGGPEGAYSGQRCWGTNLSGQYDNMADWNLTLAVDLSGVSNDSGLLMEVHMWYDTEDPYDGCVVYASSNNATWHQLTPREGYDGQIDGSYGNPLDGVDAFFGESGGWVSRSFNVSAYRGGIMYVLFRFVSDTSVNSYFGWYIDDVYVNVTGAVENIPPKAIISAPDNNSEYNTGESIYFDGTNSYDPDGTVLYYEWVSDIDGLLSTDAAFITTLSPGIHNITLTVTDDLGAQDAARVVVIVREGENHPPVAVISSPKEGDIYDYHQSVTFDGTQSTDADGDTLTYSWYSSIDGAIGTDPYMVKSDLSPGAHKITLKVTDQDGAEDEAYVNITVRSPLPNTPPEIEDHYPSSPQQSAKEGGSIRFSVNATDADANDTLTAKWYIDGSDAYDFAHGSVSMDQTTAVNEQYRPSIYAWLTLSPDYTAQGTHKVGVRVSDLEAEVWYNWTLTIENVNLPPKAVISSPVDGHTYDASVEINFDGTQSTDPDGDTLSYAWESSVSGPLSSQPQFSRKLVPGTHVITLKVTDTGGLENTTSITIIVKNSGGGGGGGVFYADCGDNRTVNVNVSVNFNASATYDSAEDTNGNGVIDWDEGEGGGIEFSWDFGDGTTKEGREVTHKYTIRGVHHVVLKATNSTGAAAYDNITVTVNGPPVAVLRLPSSYWGPGVTIEADASASYDPDGTISEYIFDFGDNTGPVKSTDGKAQHTYASTGTFVVKVTVKDEYGLEASTFQVLNVIDNGINAPIITSPLDGETVKGNVEIKGQCEGDNIASVEVEIEDSEGTAVVAWTTAQDTSTDGSWSTWRYEWDSTAVSDGEYTIRVKVQSKLGNFANERLIKVTVDNGAGGGKGGVEGEGKAQENILSSLSTLEGQLCLVAVIMGVILLAALIYTYSGGGEEAIAEVEAGAVEAGGAGEGEVEVLEAEIVEEDVGEEGGVREGEVELEGAMLTLHIQCPKCGADIEFTKGTEIVTCEECGAKGRVRYGEGMEEASAVEGEKDEGGDEEEKSTDVEGADMGAGAKKKVVKGKRPRSKGSERHPKKKKVKKKKPIEGEKTDNGVGDVGAGGEVFRTI